MAILKTLPVVSTITIANNIQNDSKLAVFIYNALKRFYSGDWGDISNEDAQLNDNDPLTALASYKIEDNNKIWIKADIDHITVLYPSEY